MQHSLEGSKPWDVESKCRLCNGESGGTFGIGVVIRDELRNFIVGKALHGVGNTHAERELLAVREGILFAKGNEM